MTGTGLIVYFGYNRLLEELVFFHPNRLLNKIIGELLSPHSSFRRHHKNGRVTVSHLDSLLGRPNGMSVEGLTALLCALNLAFPVKKTEESGGSRSHRSAVGVWRGCVCL